MNKIPVIAKAAPQQSTSAWRIHLFRSPAVIPFIAIARRRRHKPMWAPRQCW
jgi:hypothetical protein